ncbi:MAG TPA: hypothetical protein VH062_11725 [Polyangiaceae bacterium]|jgi:cytochrome c5|nr:hypothetical protein [Polyangiaceae bacterium]
MLLRAHLVLVVSVMATWACSSDPVRSHLVDSLGGEAPGVPKGPLHRPGQPCLACHGGDGPGAPDFSLAGTVYQDATSLHALPDARVHFIDQNGKTYDTATNCAGNFFVMSSDYRPAYPVWVKVFFGTVADQPVSQPMGSPIYREGSCAACHGDPAGTESVGHVYLSPVPLAVPPSPSCP